MKYIIIDRETGVLIEQVATLEEAEKVVFEYETDDIANNIYTENFYEIKSIK